MKFEISIKEGVMFARVTSCVGEMHMRTKLDSWSGN